MRALFVINNTIYGGAHAELLALRDGVASAGWEILALTPEGPGTGRDKIADAGVDVLSVPLHRLRATWDPRPTAALLAYFRADVRRIRRVIREYGVDLVQVHGAVHPHGALAAHLEGVAVCWHIYDMVAPSSVRRVAALLVRRYADVATVVGRALVDAYQGIDVLGERLVISPPAVDLKRYMDLSSRPAARAALDVNADAVVVGTVGNRLPNKGHLELIEAVRLVAERHPNVALRILGAPSPAHRDYDARVQDAAARLGDGRVKVVDPGTRVPDLLPAFDVFALPSRSEGMPVSVLEAMSCALPVVATAVGGVPEEITHGVNGLLVPPRSVPLLAESLATLVSSESLRARLGKAARDRALQEFGLDRVVAIRLHAFEKAMAHRRKRNARRGRTGSRTAGGRAAR